MRQPDPAQPRYHQELAAERDYIAHLYQRLDELREEKLRQLTAIRAQGAIGSLQNHSERDSLATLYQDRINQLEAVDDRLVFGRLSTENHKTQHIGRIGLTDHNHNRLLLDWRAEEAARFYQATGAHRMGVTSRRHIVMRGREVLSIEDEPLGAEVSDAPATSLLSAVNAPRTGRMGDIVATIQSEQDAIIRSKLPGVLVVQGGPGTGKTAVALHRAAYLLYTHRQRLANAGVLLVGPTDHFMNYIDQVLPSLGETGVVMRSTAKLYPGLTGVAETSRAVAELKGRPEMVHVVANAISLRQRSIPQTRGVRVEGMNLRVKPAQIRDARAKARATGLPHNEARETFVKVMIGKLVDQMRTKLDAASDGKNEADRSYLYEEVRSAADVRILLNMCWMPLDPQKVISELFSNPRYLVDAAPMLTTQEIMSLLRQPEAKLTEADVALVDEAAELIGNDRTQAQASAQRAEAQRQRDLTNAEATLENVHQSLTDIGYQGVLTAEDIVAAQQTSSTYSSTADRALADRSWTYGHVIVDEAQELTHMQWRMLFRRCPMKSFTIVGDTAQASGASRTWAESLQPFVGDRYRLAELTINYRTPGLITDLAAKVAHHYGRELTQATALREGQFTPETIATTDLTTGVDAAIAEQTARVPGGLIGIVTPESLVDTVSEHVKKRYAQRLWDSQSYREDRDINVVTARDTKGLEYDAVIIVEPQGMVQATGGSIGDLFVAMTRATQSLLFVTTQPAELPRGLEDTVRQPSP